MAAASGAGEKTGATLFLETKNRIVEQYMYDHLLGEDPAEHAQFVVGDFDDTTIQISSSKKTDPNVFTCHIDAPYIAQIKAAGAFEPAATALEKYLVASDSGVTLQVNSTALPEDASVVVDTFAAIKHHVAGAPYKHLLTHLQAGTSVSLAPFCVNFKGTETTYFLPGPDRVMFAYGMQFPDPTDAALVRVLCQQFADVQRTMGAAPAVSVCELGATGQTVPREITDSGLPLLTQGGEGFSGYIALTFFQGHVDDATKLANTLTLASTFRTYITYHLKAAKSYIHSRMRNRVDSLLQVLKRAHTSDPTKPKVKKGFSGKTLKQRP